jgi:hypothetical protein
MKNLALALSQNWTINGQPPSPNLALTTAVGVSALDINHTTGALAVTTELAITNPPANITGPFFIELDGRWYPYAGTQRIEYFVSPDPIIRRMQVFGANISLCFRANGDPPSGDGFPVLFGFPAPTIVFLSLNPTDSVRYFARAPRHLKFKSTFGDLSCAGEVPNPMPIIFSHGFE